MTSLSIPLVETSQVAAARRAALGLASHVGLSDRATANLGLAVSEAATNLVKHAKQGVCLLRALRSALVGNQPARRGIEVLCLDRGPGIASIADCMRDGYSTSGTLGGGLGAMKRLSRGFDIHSQPGVGTALVFEIWDHDEDAGAGGDHLVVGALSVPKRGEAVCGDGWTTRSRGNESEFLIVDGIGHGQAAADATVLAIASFTRNGDTTERQLSSLDGALRGTRGAAAAVTRIDHERRRITYCGVGNTAGTLLHADSGGRELRVEHMVSQPGTLGYSARHIRGFEYGWSAATTLVLHTDGISTRWTLDRYPGLLGRHPSLVAGVLWRDWARGEDDATIVVARGRGR